MSSISSSSSYSVGGTTNYSGISGLMSGMDTTAMVESMLAFSQAKIDSVTGEKEQLAMKQTLYREIITSINDFQNTFLNTSYGASSTNNLASSNFWNSMLSSVSGSAASVVATSSSADIGDVSLVVTQLASSTTIQSTNKISGEQIIQGSSISEEYLQENFCDAKDVVLNVNGTEVKVNLNGATSQSEVVDKFNAAFEAAGLTVTANLTDDNKLQFSDDSVTVDTDNSTESGLSTCGLTTSKVNDDGKTQATTSMNIDKGYQIDITLDGVTKLIYINDIGSVNDAGEYVVTGDDLKNALQDGVKSAFGDYVTVDGDIDSGFSFGMNFNGEEGHSLQITMIDAWKIGVQPGSSTTFNLSQTLSEVAGGDSFEFSINGVDFKFDGDTTVSSMISTINKSDAGVTMSYSSLTDTMKIVSSDSGEQYQIEMSQSTGNILSTLFGNDVIDSSSKVSSDTLTLASISGGGLATDYTSSGGSMTLTVDNKDYTFTLEDGSYTKEEIDTEFNSWLETTFGTDSTTGDAIISLDSNGTLNIAAGTTVQFAASTTDMSDDDAVAADLALAYGFATADAGSSNAVTDSTLLSDLGVFDDLNVSGLTIADLKNGITVNSNVAGGSTDITLSYSGGKVTAEDTTGNGGTITGFGSLFGDDTITLGTGAMASVDDLGDMYSAGTDSKFSFNGVETSRSSNSFTIDGVTLKLESISKKDDDGNYEETVISTARDIDSIVEGITGFVEAYNALIDQINGKLTEDASYKDYAPLTDAQKAEMTETEITNWNAKTSEGLLRNDNMLDSFLTSMRSAMYQTPTGGTLAIYQIGIDTTSEYNDKGKLEIDESKLREMIESNAEEVANLFTSTAGGLANTLSDITKAYANTSSGSTGLLVQTAGVVGTTTENNNSLYFSMSSLETTISNLTYRYGLEEARYWSQFTSMETNMTYYSSIMTMLQSEYGSY